MNIDPRWLFRVGALDAALGRLRIGTLPEAYLDGYLTVWLSMPQRIH